MASIDITATVAATLFARKLAEEIGTQGGRAIWAHLGHLVDLVRAKVAVDKHGRDAIEQVEAAPNDTDAVFALANELKAHGVTDPSFGDELAHAISEVRRDPVVGRFVTEISGQARVGKVVSFGVIHGDVSL